MQLFEVETCSTTRYFSLRSVSIKPRSGHLVHFSSVFCVNIQFDPFTEQLDVLCRYAVRSGVAIRGGPEADQLILIHRRGTHLLRSAFLMLLLKHMFFSWENASSIGAHRKKGTQAERSLVQLRTITLKMLNCATASLFDSLWIFVWLTIMRLILELLDRILSTWTSEHNDLFVAERNLLPCPMVLWTISEILNLAQSP